jgi:multiple sugar transport system permease protein
MLGWFAAVMALLWGAPRAEARRTLVIWGPGLEKSVNTIGVDAQVEVFEKRFNCRVLRLSMGAGGMDPQKLMTAIAGGVPPHLVLQDRFTVGDWASRVAIEPLDDLIARVAHMPSGVR